MGRFASVERDGPPAVITSRERDDCGKLPDDRAGVDALRLHAGGVRNGRADMRAICERHDFFRRVTSQTMDSRGRYRPRGHSGFEALRKS
jgi:hypothetical protein